jgi:hypothetical protein
MHFHFGFATADVQASVQATNLEKEVVSVLETTSVKATGFPTKSLKAEIIKEISHLVGDSIEVDESSLLQGKALRVKVWCKDASKLECSTLVYINGQGHMITWWSERLEGKRGAKGDEDKFFKGDMHREDSGDEEDKEDSLGSHDSGFQKRLAKEQKRKKIESSNSKRQLDRCRRIHKLLWLKRSVCYLRLTL